MKKPFFIVIEGLDGSGKSTAARHLAQMLESRFEKKTLLTFEPHDPSCAGRYIRQVLTKKITRFTPRVLALAFAANRLDHNDRTIKPHLEKGDNHVVISDRYYLSSLVYQSTNDFPLAAVMQLNELALPPDLFFFLNVSNKVCYERMTQRNQPRELFEENLEETRKKYLQAIDFLKKERNETIIEIDGNGSVRHTVGQMLEGLKKNSLL